MQRVWGRSGPRSLPSPTLAPRPLAAPCTSGHTRTAPRPAAADPAPACPSALADARPRARGLRPAPTRRGPRPAGSCGGHVGTSREPQAARARAAGGRMPPPPLPVFAGAFPRAELAAPALAAAPSARRPELGPLRRAPLQQLLPAPRAAPLQLPQLLLVPPLQLHDALQLPQLLQASGPRLCWGRREARGPREPPPTPSPGPSPGSTPT